MTHVEFISEVTKRLEWPEENTTGIIETILDIISAELKVNNPVLIDGFGSLKTAVEPEYILVDPETKDRYLMPPSIEVVFEAFFREKEDNPFLQAAFMPDETLYNDLNLSFSQFEPTLLNEGVQFPGIPEIIVEEPKEEIETTEYALSQEVESKTAGQPHSQEEETVEYPQKEDHISVGQYAQSDGEIKQETEKPLQAPEETVQAEEVRAEEVQAEEVPLEEVPLEETSMGAVPIGAVPENVIPVEPEESVDFVKVPKETEPSVKGAHTIQTGLAEQTVSTEQTVSAEQTISADQAVSAARTAPDSVIKSPPRYRSSRRRQKSKKTSAVWIPIAGGIAIIVASLFFFKGERNR